MLSKRSSYHCFVLAAGLLYTRRTPDFLVDCLSNYIPFYCFYCNFVHSILLDNEDTCTSTKASPTYATCLYWWVLWYLLRYDKSYYHIDNVREPMIRVLFFESMLLGAWFRQNDSRFGEGQFRWWHILVSCLALCCYFASKLLFSKVSAISEYQLLNQVLIFILLFWVFRTSSGARDYLSKLPKCIKFVVHCLSQITLEIYVVQYVLIELIRPWFAFPLNWIVLTASILISAILLHSLCLYISAGLNKLKETNQI